MHTYFSKEGIGRDNGQPPSLLVAAQHGKALPEGEEYLRLGITSSHCNTGQIVRLWLISGNSALK